MTEHVLDTLLKNYTDLITRVDEHIHRLARFHDAHLACKKGCDECCRHLSLFPVEAFALSRAFGRLDESCRERVLDQAQQTDRACPLLVDHVCRSVCGPAHYLPDPRVSFIHGKRRQGRGGFLSQKF